nr:uncharacterized protein LOC108121403 [Drosophila bipectinata]
MRKFMFLVVLAVMGYVGHTRTIPVPTEPPSGPASNKNSTANATLEATAPKATTFDAPAIKSVVIHIPRKRRESEPTIPMDFLAIHTPCEFDLHPEVIYKWNWEWRIYDWNRGETRNCQWFYSMRYTTEGFYRIYSLLRMEAFFFGTYSERLYRYEYDLHFFDYWNVKIPPKKREVQVLK